MVKVYTREGCGPCSTLKYWLSRKGVNFQEISYDLHPELYPSQFRIFPLTEVDGEYVQGQNISRIAELLRL